MSRLAVLFALQASLAGCPPICPSVVLAPYTEASPQPTPKPPPDTGRARCRSGLAHPHKVHPLSPGNPSIQETQGFNTLPSKRRRELWGLRPREPVSRQNTLRREAPPRKPWPPNRCYLYNSGEDFVGPRGTRIVIDALSLGRAAWKARSMEHTRMSRPSTGHGLIGRVPGRSTCHSTSMLSGPFQSRHVRSHPCDVRCGPARTNSESLT